MSIVTEFIDLLVWWNTRIFPFTKKSYLHRAQWRYYIYLSRVRILVLPWLLTWLANYKRASLSGARPVLLKKSCLLCMNFISIYKINRTFHGRFAHSWEILSAFEDKIRIPKRPHNILYNTNRTVLLNFKLIRGGEI